MDVSNMPAAEFTPPAAPVLPVALSTVTAAPVPAALKKEIRAHRGRSSLIFTVLVALLVAAMFFNGIYSMPNGDFSATSFYALLFTLALIGIWKILMLLIDRATPKPVAFDLLRVNEVYEQGVMSTGPLDRVVIPFDEVTSFVETKQWLALYSRTGEIVWLASDLTPADAQTLFAALASHLPQTVFIRKAVLMPCKPFDTAPLPSIPFDPPLETLPARWSVKEAIARGYAAMLKRGAPLFFLMSMVLANALCDGFGIFSDAPMAGRFLLMATAALVCSGLGWLLVAWEQTTATKAQNRKGVCLHLLADGVRVQDGAEFTVIPQDGLHAFRDKNGTLCLPLDNRVLTVSYPDFCRSMRAREIFKL